MAQTKDYYLILGVPRDATSESIRKAFCRRARDSHPDHSGSTDPEAFRDLVEAYETLSDPRKRRLYDGAAAAAAPGVRVTRGWTPAGGPPRAGFRGRRPATGAPEPLIPEPGAGFGPEPLIPEIRDDAPEPPAAFRHAGGRRPGRPPGGGPESALLQFLLRSLRLFP